MLRIFLFVFISFMCSQLVQDVSLRYFTYDALIKLLIACLLSLLACLLACLLDWSSIGRTERSICRSVDWLIDVFMTISSHGQQSRIRNVTACLSHERTEGSRLFPLIKTLPNCVNGQILRPLRCSTTHPQLLATSCKDLSGADGCGDIWKHFVPDLSREPTQ